MILRNKSLEYFDAWGGGLDTLNTLIDHRDCDAVESLIETVFDDHTPENVEINDFLWFERDTIAEHLGFSDWDAYECGEQDEAEGDEDDEEAEREAIIERAAGILQERFPRIKWSVKADFARYMWDETETDDQNCIDFAKWIAQSND